MTAPATPTASVPRARTMPGRGNWWIQPVSIAVGFSLFVIYSFWSVAFGAPHHTAGPYLSPFYSPVLKFGWWPLSSAFLVAWVPLGFRATCYYYRKAYYRAFFFDPPACAINEPGFRRHYTGETRLPFILNNFHRYFSVPGPYRSRVSLVRYRQRVLLPGQFLRRHRLCPHAGQRVPADHVHLLLPCTSPFRGWKRRLFFLCLRRWRPKGHVGIRHPGSIRTTVHLPGSAWFRWLPWMSISESSSSIGNCFGLHTGC